MSSPHPPAVHTDAEPYGWLRCPPNVPTRRDRNDVRRQQQPFRCHVCDALFAEKRQLWSHMASTHERSQTFVCGICNAKFGRKNNMHRHVQTVHEKQRPYECKACGMCFGEKGNLLTHARRKHAQCILDDQL